MKPGYQIFTSALATGIVPALTDPQIIIGFGVFILLLIGSALVSGSEVAFFSLRPEDIEKLKSDKSKKAKSALTLYSNPEKLLSTILVANNTINIAIVLLAAFLSTRLFDFSDRPVLGFIINIVVITFTLLFFGEVIPKVYSSRAHMKVVLLMAVPISVIEKLVKPVTSLLILSSSFVKKRTNTQRKNISMDDISDALDLASEDIDEDEKILKGIVNFGNINVSAIMCPRIDVTALDIKSGFDKVVPVIVESGFSRIPVFSDSFDSVKGILYAKDVLPFTNNPAIFKWQSLLRPPYYVPETKKINDLLKEFQTKKIHLAIVIDEYGGTSGIVTLEDILEEIVGEITDESDEDEIMYRTIDETTFIFEGKVLLNDFCKIINIEEDFFETFRGEAETLAGLILEVTGEIPQKGLSVVLQNFKFSIESADRRRIKEIRVEIINEEPNAAQE
ncbi:MAG TPA: gliding motility-associated protein GldE [Bacteroidales bacterium]|nr:gliding motility-associated protein GldE [Bacteroidales bacterium]